MNNIFQKIKDNFNVILLCFLVLLFFRQCSVNSNVAKIKKENLEISAKLDSINTLTRGEMREEMNQVMFEFLIYEDDFDKKKISLSDIKNKIEGEDK
jgi:hypothetical protein